MNGAASPEQLTRRTLCKSRRDAGVQSAVAKSVGIITRSIVKDDSCRVVFLLLRRYGHHSNGAVVGSHKRLAFRFDRHGRDTPKIIERVHDLLPPRPTPEEARFLKALQKVFGKAGDSVG